MEIHALFASSAFYHCAKPKNASVSETELKDRTQTSRTAAQGCSVEIFVVSDYQSSRWKISVVGNAPITKVM